PTLWDDARRRPQFFRHPAPRSLVVERLRRNALLHPRAKHRLVHDPGVDALQPLIPPAKRLLQETDRGPGHAVVRIDVPPGADQAFARTAETGEEARDRIRVRVGPTADRVNRAGDRAVVFAHRPVLPVAVATRVADPGLGQELGSLEPLEPHRSPA